MATIFTKIVNGEIPASKIAETDEFLAFLDVSPLVMGHTLVIPKKEINYIFEVDDDLLARMMVFAKKVAKAVEISIPCKRIGVAVIGLEVPHCHIHLIPLNTMNDINFTQPKLSPSKEELTKVCELIVSNYKE
jgi:histidine triad (HIT) family protein